MVVNRWMDEWMDGCVDVSGDGWVGKWRGWMDEQTDDFLLLTGVASTHRSGNINRNLVF
jgi:hypothetical protein